MVTTIPDDLGSRKRLRSERERASQKRRAAEAPPEPPPMTLSERQAMRVARAAAMPQVRAGRQRQTKESPPSLRQQVETLTAEVQRLKQKAGRS